MSLEGLNPIQGAHLSFSITIRSPSLQTVTKRPSCKELGIPVSYSINDFTGKPLDELKYVVSVNLHRRHLDEFQRAEIALKYDKLYRKIARDRWASTKFTNKSGQEAINKGWDGENNNGSDDADADDDNITSEISATKNLLTFFELITSRTFLALSKSLFTRSSGKLSHTTPSSS